MSAKVRTGTEPPRDVGVGHVLEHVRRPEELHGLRDELIQMMQGETGLRFYRLCSDCRHASCSLVGEPVAQFPAAVIC